MQGSEQAASTESGRRGQRIVSGSYLVLTVAVAGYVVSLFSRRPGTVIPALDDWLITGIELVGALLGLASALVVGSHRRVSLALGSAVLVWATGDLIWVIWAALAPGAVPPSPSIADLFYLAFYPLMYAALALLARKGTATPLRGAWLDGLMCALVTAASSAAFVFDKVLAATHGDSLTVAVNLAYPLGDAILLSIAIAALAVQSRRRDIQWMLIVAGTAAFVVSDTEYLLQSAAGTYQVGGLTDIGWPVGLLAISLAAWMFPRQAGQREVPEPGQLVSRRHASKLSLVMPVCAASIGGGILVYGNWRHLNLAAVVLSSLTLLLAAVRAFIAQHDLRVYAESRRLAVTDELTGLGNRRLFDQELKRAITAVPEADDGTVAVDRRVALLLIDLERFKEINDSFGHVTGDQLLRKLAERLRATVRRSDVLVRFVGDEFAILLRGSDTDYAIDVARRVIGELQQRFLVDDVSLQVRAHVGIARFPEDGSDPATLLRCADVAMFRARSAGLGFTIYDQARDDTRNRFDLIGDLRQAIADRSLSVCYQPQLDLETGSVVSVEALVRWHHPEKGMIPPDMFIPLAEDTGLIRPITAFMLDRSLEQCALWRELGIDVAVAVNISANDILDYDLVAHVEQLLERYELPPRVLTLEITERVLMADLAQAGEAVRRLQNRGVTVSIDDFGTGFSSLAYLRELAVGELKLAGTFIIAITAEDADRDRAIVRSIIDLAHALRLRVVAEGIEDDRTLGVLKDLGCDLGQGYYIGRPQPAAVLELRSSASDLVG